MKNKTYIVHLAANQLCASSNDATGDDKEQVFVTGAGGRVVSMVDDVDAAGNDVSGGVRIVHGVVVFEISMSVFVSFVICADLVFNSELVEPIEPDC